MQPIMTNLVEKRTTFPTEWTDYNQQPKGSEWTFGNRMFQYCCYGLWDNDVAEVREERMRGVVRLMRRLYPNEDIDGALETAQKWLGKSRSLITEVSNSDLLSQFQLQRAEELGGPLPGLIKSLRPNIELKKESSDNEIADDQTTTSTRDKLVPLTSSNAHQTIQSGHSKKNPQDSSQKKVGSHPARNSKASSGGNSGQHSLPPKRTRKGKTCILKEKHVIQIQTYKRRKPNHDLSLEEILSKGSSNDYHPNFICALAAEDEWNLYIDESGDNFDSGEEKGLIAGVLCGVSNPLPPQKAMHAKSSRTEEEFKAEDMILDTILHHPQTGVLAIPGKFRSLHGWSSQIISFIGVVLRMLPLPCNKEENVTLNVYIEQRFPYEDSNSFVFLHDACIYYLQEAHPNRASRIKLLINAMDKNYPYNAYADLTANTCYAKNPLSKRRLAKLGWLGECLMCSSSIDIQRELDRFYSVGNLSEQDWNRIVTNSTADFMNMVLSNAYGDEAQKDESLWEQYLNWTVQQLSSKAIDVTKLQKQLSWLNAWKPAGKKLPPRLELLWLTTRLTTANHLGEVEDEASAEGKAFRKLSKQLRDEDAPLVCWAYLNLAEAQTNAYQFEEARRLLQEYINIYLETPSNARYGIARIAAIPGLLYYGQILSSFGQYEAFLGDYPKAIQFFREAISNFKRLSDKQVQEYEIDHTQAFLATVQMDLAPDAPETRAELEIYMKGKLVVAASALASSNAKEDKYHQQILLRYLTHCQVADRQIRDAYLGKAHAWQTGERHPWELIEFYRALLLPQGPKQQEHLEKAYRIALEGGGPTLQVIATVILGAILFLNQGDTTRHEEYSNWIDKLAQELPALGEKRVTVLRNQLKNPIPPLELAKIVLPFNFR